MSETPKPAMKGKKVKKGTPSEPVAQPEVSRRHESWPHDDVKRLVRGIEYLQTRNVEFGMTCGDCGKALRLEGRDGGGATLVGCRCAVRRWL